MKQQKVLILVNTMDGKQIKVMVDPQTDTMGQIKEQLADESGLEPENQKLSMNGIELENDDKTPAFYGIPPGGQIDLERKSFMLNVIMPDAGGFDGQTLQLELISSDTTDGIKAKIE